MGYGHSLSLFIYIYVCVYIYMYVYVCVCIYIYIYIYIYTHTYIHNNFHLCQNVVQVLKFSSLYYFCAFKKNYAAEGQDGIVVIAHERHISIADLTTCQGSIAAINHSLIYRPQSGNS
jgi:hypothetical protein